MQNSLMVLPMIRLLFVSSNLQFTDQLLAYGMHQMIINPMPTSIIINPKHKYIHGSNLCNLWGKKYVNCEYLLIKSGALRIIISWLYFLPLYKEFSYFILFYFLTCRSSPYNHRTCCKPCISACLWASMVGP